jgi:uncharacterized membrane protein YhiD involved in acid resistance
VGSAVGYGRYEIALVVSLITLLVLVVLTLNAQSASGFARNALKTTSSFKRRMHAPLT